MGKNQYRPFDRSVGNASVDVSMHYSAATNFADNMKVLAKIDNNTGYNFTTMQTGAYINTGIFMNIMRNLKPDYKEYATFKIFEMAVILLNTAGFYMLISDKLKSKTNYIIGMIFLVLYAYAYPYTSLLYGFSYLSVARRTLLRPGRWGRCTAIPTPRLPMWSADAFPSPSTGRPTRLDRGTRC